MTKPPRLPASIEASAKQIQDGKLPIGLLPPETKVYITDIGNDTTPELIKAARMATDANYCPVPHIAARRMTSESELVRRIAGFTQEGGVEDMLMIAGEADYQMGPYDSVLSMIESGCFDHYGVRSMAVAGHPEGNSNYPTITAVEEVLRQKADYASRTNADMRIVTQFGFDAPAFIRWAERVRISGVYLPIHIGVAGPAKITTLLKYAMMCGVGNSIAFLRKRASAITALATSYSPEGVVGPLEDYAAENPDGPIQGIHVFPFGGLNKASGWLEERGNWDIKTSLYGNSNIGLIGATYK